jgi:hypothetical protein
MFGCPVMTGGCRPFTGICGEYVGKPGACSARSGSVSAWILVGLRGLFGPAPGGLVLPGNALRVDIQEHSHAVTGLLRDLGRGKARV